MTALQTLGDHVAVRMRGSLTPDAHELIKLHAVDTMAAWVSGAHTDEGKRLLAYRDKLAETQPGLLSDITINCALARLTEVDDIHLASMTTPGAFIVPAALSIAAARPQVDATTLAEAMTAGYEAMTRLGTAINGPTVLYRGIWPSYLSAGFGVAAVAARLTDLTADQTAHALALAFNMSGPGVGQHGAPSTARWLAAGAAARNGALAAHAASAGFTADLGILDGKYLAGVFDITPKLGALTARLGDAHAVQDVSFKPWCAARQTMAATQAFTELIAREVQVADVSAVEAMVPPPMLRMIDHGIVEGDRLSWLTSLQYQLAIAALAPEQAFNLSPAGPVTSGIHEFMTKVKVLPDDALMEGFPSLWRARVRVQAAGGWHEHQIAQIPGDPGRPFTQADVREKFHRLADKAIGADRVERLADEASDVLDGRRTPGELITSIASALT